MLSFPDCFLQIPLLSLLIRKYNLMKVYPHMPKQEVESSWDGSRDFNQGTVTKVRVKGVNNGWWGTRDRQRWTPWPLADLGVKGGNRVSRQSSETWSWGEVLPRHMAQSRGTGKETPHLLLWSYNCLPVLLLCELNQELESRRTWWCRPPKVQRRAESRRDCGRQAENHQQSRQGWVLIDKRIATFQGWVKGQACW